MNERRYKAFLDEMTDDDRLRFQDGSFVESKWGSKEIEDMVAKITKILLNKGYRILGTGNYGTIAFSKPEYVSSAYVGTFLNPYTVKEKVQLWSDNFAFSHKSILITEVFRHNGTAKDSSIKLTVMLQHGPNTVEYKKMDFKIDNKVEYYDVCHAFPGKIEGQLIRKFQPGKISDKVLMKIIAAAEAALDNYTIDDVTKWAVDGDKYHQSTEIEYRKYQRAEREKAKNNKN